MKTARISLPISNQGEDFRLALQLQDNDPEATFQALQFSYERAVEITTRLWQEIQASGLPVHQILLSPEENDIFITAPEHFVDLLIDKGLAFPFPADDEQLFGLGSVDDISIYPHALSPEEIAALYAQSRRRVN
jgi:hypothetical protein